MNSREIAEVIALERESELLARLEENRQGRTRRLLEQGGRVPEGAVLVAVERSGLLAKKAITAEFMERLKAAENVAEVERLIAARRQELAEIRDRAGQGNGPTDAEAFDALRAASDCSRLPLRPADKERKREPWEAELAGAVTAPD
jgi:hypothetical protein